MFASAATVKASGNNRPGSLSLILASSPLEATCFHTLLPCAVSSQTHLEHQVSLSSAPTLVHLRKGRGDERIAKLVDSPDCPEGEATYALHAGGWEGGSI